MYAFQIIIVRLDQGLSVEPCLVIINNRLELGLLLKP